ncbi:MAG: ATP-binding protein, partial [Bacteroidales bacterium]|nr:ATP-binding protein [Bacteroidales bacterium]
MQTQIDTNNANLNGQLFLFEEIKWFQTIFTNRLKHYFQQNGALFDIHSIAPPGVSDVHGDYASFVHENQLKPEERLILSLAIVPHIYPHLLDDIIVSALNKQGEFPQIGGDRGATFRGFIPTLETALFLLAGNDIAKRFEYQSIFENNHIFSKKNVLYVLPVKPGEPKSSGKLVIDPEFVDLFTLGKITKPTFSPDFPAELITTKLDWNDLVLTDRALKQVKDLEEWIAHHRQLMEDWGMQRRLAPGYRVLFHGPPGTGKTLTATLLGKYSGKDVFKIDLSMVVSKYIGETEKNLSSLFDKAKNKDWILFFDEADALFGKRTNIRDAHDKYANQEVSYLLQRVESYPGLVILASNFRRNIDDAFTRRFQSMIYFPVPKNAERLKLWENAFPKQVKLDDDIIFKKLAHEYELTGANIMNIVQYTCLKALARNSNIVSLQD